MLYTINESQPSPTIKSASEHVYKTDIDNVDACNLYVKAIERVLSNTTRVVELISRIHKEKRAGLPDTDIARRKEIASKTIHSKQIIEEFTTALRIVHTEAFSDIQKRVAHYFERLDTQVTRLFLLENPQHGEGARIVGASLIKMFQQIRELIVK